MKFVLPLILLLGVCQTQSTAEFEYELEIELRNLTLYALENNIAEEHLDQFIGKPSLTVSYSLYVKKCAKYLEFIQSMLKSKMINKVPRSIFAISG